MAAAAAQGDLEVAAEAVEMAATIAEAEEMAAAAQWKTCMGAAAEVEEMAAAIISSGRGDGSSSSTRSLGGSS